MIARLFRMKTILFFLAILSVIFISPEQLFSWGQVPPPQTKQMILSQGAEVKRSSPTTSKSSAPTIETEERAKAIQVEQQLQSDLFQRPSLLTQGLVLTILSLSPFIVMILTSFLKIVIVLSLLRNALGVQQAPPNQILNGVALMLSLFIMYPTALRMYKAAEGTIAELTVPDSIISPESSEYIVKVGSKMIDPLRNFLIQNSSTKHRALFYKIAYKILPNEFRATLKPEDIIIIVPAYVTSQLKDAFEIGVLIYIPFFVIDLVTSNVLLAMGMMMLSPVTISMPLKLFLLVMLDGWTLLIDGLVNTFRT